MPYCLAAANNSDVRLAPSSREYSVCRCRCTKSSCVAMADVRSFSRVKDGDGDILVSARTIRPTASAQRPADILRAEGIGGDDHPCHALAIAHRRLDTPVY